MLRLLLEKLLFRILGRDSSQQNDIGAVKNDILNNRKVAIEDLTKLNKRITLVIERGEVEVIIKNISDLSNKK